MWACVNISGIKEMKGKNIHLFSLFYFEQLMSPCCLTRTNDRKLFRLLQQQREREDYPQRNESVVVEAAAMLLLAK